MCIRDSVTPYQFTCVAVEPDEVADVVTATINAQNITIAPVSYTHLTMTFTKTNTTLWDLAESFKYACTVAHQSGMSFENASAALGVLGDAVIQGSHAGTTLRMMLLNMRCV